MPASDTICRERRAAHLQGTAASGRDIQDAEELETKLDNGAAMLQVLGRIGMSVCFRYQKYRQEFELDAVHVAVDETPIGNYVEFEGTEEGILGLADRMQIEESRFLRLSYYSLYREHCQKTGEIPSHMVYQDSIFRAFDPESRI